MSEVVNALVAFAVIVFIFRWATSSSSNTNTNHTRSATAALGFRPKHVTQDMVDQIHTMFPDIPIDNIRFDLLRTGNVVLTSNKILERGFLEPPPPAYFTLYPRSGSDATTQVRLPQPERPASSGSATSTRPRSLIERYHLEQHLAEAPHHDTDVSAGGGGGGGKARWEDTAEKREESLRERKAQMVLAARQRMLAQQQKETSASGSGSS